MSRQKTATKAKSRSAAKKQPVRDDRIYTRTSAAKKALYEQVAARKGVTLTEFVEASLDEATERAQQEFTSMKLSQRESQEFVAAMLSDAEPGPRLKKAAQRLKDLTGS